MTTTRTAASEGDIELCIDVDAAGATQFLILPKLVTNPLLSPLEQRWQEFDDCAELIEKRWHKNLDLIKKAKDEFNHAEQRYQAAIKTNTVSTAIIGKRNTALEILQKSIHSMTELLEENEGEAIKLAHPSGNDKNSKLGQRLAVRYQGIIDPCKRVLESYQKETATLIPIDYHPHETPTATQPQKSGWLLSFWKKVSGSKPQPESVKKVPDKGLRM